METEVFVVRHAQTSGMDIPNASRPLSETGQYQAQALANFLLCLGIQVVYTSPFKRAFQTVEPFCITTGIRPVINEALRESEKEEALPQVRQRMFLAVKEITDIHPGKRIVLCTHGGTLWGLISYFDNTFGYEDYLKIGNPDEKRFVFGEGRAHFDDGFSYQLGGLHPI